MHLKGYWLIMQYICTLTKIVYQLPVSVTLLCNGLVPRLNTQYATFQDLMLLIYDYDPLLNHKLRIKSFYSYLSINDFT